jgi:hypothetical protein
MRPPGMPFGVLGQAGSRRCAFCNRREASVGHFVSARGTYVCDACIIEARELLDTAPAETRILRLKPAQHSPDDRASAESAIEAAFEAVFGSAPETGRSDAIEGGTRLAATMQEVRARVPQRDQMDVAVDSIRFVDIDEAEVRFSLYFAGGMPTGGMAEVGHAVLDGDTWKVSRETWCRLISRIGVQCPPG